MWVVTLSILCLFDETLIFQSTPPVWVVTLQKVEKSVERIISIHTTRVGGDETPAEVQTKDEVFQSTPPVWVVTSIGSFHNFH